MDDASEVFYDRPATPVSFTGSRNHRQSHVGFTAPQTGRYVAEVIRLDLAGLRVARESYYTGEGQWIEDGEFRSGTFNQRRWLMPLTGVRATG